MIHIELQKHNNKYHYHNFFLRDLNHKCKNKDLRLKDKTKNQSKIYKKKKSQFNKDQPSKSKIYLNLFNNPKSRIKKIKNQII